MKLYSSNEINKTTTSNISSGDSLTTFFASKSEPIEILGNTTQTGTPTPSSPVAIENVTGLQEITITGTDISNTYEIDLNSSTKNKSNNLYNYKNTETVSSGITTDSDGWITATLNSPYTGGLNMYYRTENLDLDYNTTYAIFVETKEVNLTGGGFSLLVVDSDSTKSQFRNNFILDLDPGERYLESNKIYKNINYTKRSNETGYLYGLSTRIRFWPNTTGTIKFRISVIKDTSITTNTFKYEPFNKTQFIDYNNCFAYSSATTLTKIDNGIDVSNTSNTGKGAFFYITNAEKNTDYVLTYDYQSVSSGYNNVEIYADFDLNISLGSATNKNQLHFNTKSYSKFIVLFYGSNNAVGESKYTNISLTRYIELNNIGTYRDRIFKSKGKNIANDIFSDYDSSNASYSIYPIKLEQGATYTLKATLVGEKKTNYYNYGIVKDGTNYSTFVDLQTCVDYGTGNTFTKTFTVDSSYTNPKLVCFVQQSETKFNELFTNYQIQLEKRSSASEYEPYGEPSWYIEKQIGKVILDGSENWGEYSSQTSDGYRVYTDTYKLGLTGALSYDTVLSDYFQSVAYLQKNSINLTKYATYLNIDNTVANTIANFKTWLSTHNTNVYYVLAQPTYTKIENEELITQLESVLNLYKGVNNITITSSNLPSQLKVEFKDGFTHNGLGIITDVLEAKITEQINGDYYLDFKVVINNSLADYITYNNIVSCKVEDGTEQLFRIKRVVKDFTTISVYATHIFYDLIDNVLINVAPTNLYCEDYGRWLLSHTDYWTPFTFSSNIPLVKNSGRYIRKNVVESMIGNIDNSMLNKFSGEIVRDNFDLALNQHRGSQYTSAVKLLFGKNISSIEITTDIENMATRIIPVGYDGLMIPEQYIDSPLINDYPQPKMAVVEFSDIKYEPIVEGETPSEDAYHDLNEAYQALRDSVYKLYENGADKPQINIKIDWVELSKTKEYENYADLEKVSIGDRIHAYILGMDYITEIKKTIYNVLTDRIENFEMGTISGSIVTAVNGNTQAIQSFNPNELLASASNNAQQQIINALGGTYGQIGGFKISSDKLWTEYFPPADYTQTDRDKLSDYLLDPEANPLTQEEIAKYDIFGDGDLTAKDLLYMDYLIINGITTSNPLVLSMQTGYQMLDSGFKITDGNGRDLIGINFMGYSYHGKNITPRVYLVNDTIEYTLISSVAYLTTRTTKVIFTIPYKGYIYGTPTVYSGTVYLRTSSGFLSSDSDGISVGDNGYTFEVIDVDNELGIMTISITKSSAFTGTGATNNSSLNAAADNLVIKIE